MAIRNKTITVVGMLCYQRISGINEESHRNLDRMLAFWDIRNGGQNAHYKAIISELINKLCEN
jgi:hypothetical protein